MGALVWRILGTGAALGSSAVTRNVIELVWKKVTGKAPPQNPLSPRTTWADAIAWALVSGAVVQVGRMLATRQAARFYQVSTGHLPKGMQEVG